MGEKIGRRAYYSTFQFCSSDPAVTFDDGWDLADRLERLAVNAKVATVLGSIPASSDPVESERRHGRWSSVE